VALSEALDVLHWVMCPASYRHIRIAIEIASYSPAFFSLLPTAIAYQHGNNFFKLKQRSGVVH
jgi:hypothetical protein